MTFDRRSIIGAGLGFGAIATVAQATEKSSYSQRAATAAEMSPGLAPDPHRDQTAALQAAVDQAAEKDVPLILPPGKFAVSNLRLRSGTRLLGTARATTLAFSGNTIENAPTVSIQIG